MAYTLASLKRTLLHGPEIKYRICNTDFESLFDRVRIILVFMKVYIAEMSSSEVSRKNFEILERQIIDAVHKTEDVIESHFADQLAPRFKTPRNEISSRISSRDMEKIIREFDLIGEKIMRALGAKRVKEIQRKERAKYLRRKGEIQENSFSPADMSFLRNVVLGFEHDWLRIKINNFDRESWSPDVVSSSSKNIMVGFERDMLSIKNRLGRTCGGLQLIKITGMGGIGKTTLARNLYNDLIINRHFDIHVWVTISEEHNDYTIIQNLLCRIISNHDEMGSDPLEVKLRRILMYRKYLIVLDNIWSNKEWDELDRVFPDNDNGSVLMLTTRQSDVASNYSTFSTIHHEMQFLDPEQRWELLSKLVFPHEDCPLELEEIGKKIAEKCIGLPLAISVIAQLLSTAKCRQYFWLHVAENVSSILCRDTQLLDILYTSYYYLPYYLKPCFLYMGTFPRDFEVPSSKLVRLWVAEGLVKSSFFRSFEDVGERYLWDLVNRNMIMVTRYKLNGKIKACSIHYLFRDICVRKAGEENFFGIENNNVYGHYSPKHQISPRRVAGNPSHSGRYILESGRQMSFTRSFLFNGPAPPSILSPVLFRLRLLKILDVYEIIFDEFPEQFLKLVNLRYLAITCRSSLPAMAKFLNLETLIFREISTFLAKDTTMTCFWAMEEFRHAKFKETYICLDPESMGDSVLENLRTLSTMRLKDGISYSKFFEGSMPNLRKLGISFGFSRDKVIDLSHLEKLETLKCLCDSLLVWKTFLSSLKFPPSIKKLTLSCSLGFEPWMSMTTIGSLPNLQVLKLQNVTYKNEMFRQYEWNPRKGQFRSLKYLLLENFNLAHWRARNVHFPRLKHLVIRCCPALEQIPVDFGEHYWLKMIELDGCSPSAMASAMQIQKHQHRRGVEKLQLRINGLAIDANVRYDHLSQDFVPDAPEHVGCTSVVNLCVIL